MCRFSSAIITCVRRSYNSDCFKYTSTVCLSPSRRSLSDVYEVSVSLNTASSRCFDGIKLTLMNEAMNTVHFSFSSAALAECVYRPELTTQSILYTLAELCQFSSWCTECPQTGVWCTECLQTGVWCPEDLSHISTVWCLVCE